MTRPLTALPLVATVRALALALVLALGLAVPALAHAELVSSDPADKAVLSTPPTAITLTFSEALDAGKSSFKLLGPDGTTVGTGAATAEVVMTLDGLTLGPGDYEIQWTSASAADGDIDRGTLGFSVLEPTAASATPAASAVASAAATTASQGPATTAPSPVATPLPANPAPASSSADVVIPIIVALVVVAGIGVLVLRRSRQA